MNTLNYETTPHFDKCFKKLLKRFRTLKDDFELVKKATVELYYGLDKPIDNGSIFQIPGLCDEHIHICKIKKFACKSLKGGARSGLRVTFAYLPSLDKVVFIEVYYKGDRENEDRKLINSIRAELVKDLIL